LRGEGIVLDALRDEPLDVDVSHGHHRLEVKAFGLGHDQAVLRDERMAGPDRVCRRLAGPGSRVEVRGQAAGGLLCHECAAIMHLAEQLVAGGRVEQQRRAGQRHSAARRVDGPQVLADLDADDQAVEVVRSKEQVRPEGDGRPVPGHRRGGRERPRGEPAFLVKLVRGGQERLDCQARDTALRDERRAVEQLARNLNRQTDDNGDARFGRGRRDGRQRLAGARQQQGLVQQVATGIRRDAQLRKEREPAAAARGLAQRRDDGFRVERNVRHAQLRRDDGHADEAKFGG